MNFKQFFLLIKMLVKKQPVSIRSVKIVWIYNTEYLENNNIYILFVKLNFYKLDPRICKLSLTTIKLENRAQKVGWKTFEREKLICIRESVSTKPYSDV